MQLHGGEPAARDLGDKASHLLGKLGIGCEHLRQVGRDHRGVDHVFRRPAFEDFDALLCNRDCHVELRLDRACPEMRGDDDLVEGQERGFGRGLGLEDIERCTGNLAALDRIVERLLIDDAATGTVDDPDTVFHRGDALCVDDMLGLGDQRGVDGDDVGDLEEVGHGHHLDTELGSPFLGYERVVGNDLHVHGDRPLGKFPADPAESRRYRASSRSARCP